MFPGGAVPSGWTGNAHAGVRGANGVSKDASLCLMDADTRAEPGLPRAAVAEVVRRRVGLLSLEPFQELGGAGARDGKMERPRGAANLTPGTHARTLWNEGKLKDDSPDEILDTSCDDVSDPAGLRRSIRGGVALVRVRMCRRGFRPQ